MKSQRELTKSYNTLIERVKNEDFYKIDLTNRVNCYSCSCGHITKTIDIDAGVTPMMFSCEDCGGMARSNFYKDIAPLQEPTIEWYRPDLRQALRMRKNQGLLGHILQGGLAHRKIKHPF